MTRLSRIVTSVTFILSLVYLIAGIFLFYSHALLQQRHIIVDQSRSSSRISRNSTGNTHLTESTHDDNADTNANSLEEFLSSVYPQGKKPENDMLIAFYIVCYRFLQNSERSGLKVMVSSLTGLEISASSTSNNQNNGQTGSEVLNMIRIPKAGSSFLSITGRALAGCPRDGYPCCERPFDICPFNSTKCGALRGCTDHVPDYSQDPSKNTSVPLITQLRDPEQRLLSGFFYGGNNRAHNDNKGCLTYTCFEQYVSDDRYRNVMTKMLLGVRPYADQDVALRASVKQAEKQLCAFEWFGMLDMPLASSMLVYESGLFSKLVPNTVVFGLPPTDDATNTERWKLWSKQDKWKLLVRDSSIKRNQETTDKRKEFVSGAYKDQRGEELVMKHNSPDYEIYNFAKRLFCARVREAGLNKLANFFKATNHFQECIEVPVVALKESSKSLCPYGT